MESLIGLVTPTPEAYGERIAPRLVSADLEGHSGAMFNAKGQALLPSPKLADGAHVAWFLAESEALVARVAPLRPRDRPRGQRVDADQPSLAAPGRWAAS